MFVLSVDGMLGKEALVILANFSQIMASKMYEPIPHVHGYIKGQILIDVAKSYSQMIRGARLTNLLRDRKSEWRPA